MVEQKIISNFVRKTKKMEPLKISKNESGGRSSDVSGAFKIANQQAFDDGKRRGEVEAMQREIYRIKEFTKYIELLQKRYKTNLTLVKIKEYYLNELKNFKIKE